MYLELPQAIVVPFDPIFSMKETFFQQVPVLRPSSGFLSLAVSSHAQLSVLLVVESCMGKGLE